MLKAMLKIPRYAARPCRDAPRRATASRALSALRPGLSLLLLVACGTEGFEPPPGKPDGLYWALALDHRAVTLATGARYNTLALAAVPLSGAGEAIADFPTPTYLSRDPATVKVTPEGVLQAVAATAEPVWVVATLTVGNVTHADSVRVRVVDTDDPPMLAVLSVQSTPGDSAKIAMELPGQPANMMPPLAVHATDDHGEPINDVPIAFRSSNDLVARIDPVTGAITPTWLGSVTFYVAATVFGVTKTDSVRYQIGAPIYVTTGVTAPGSDQGQVSDFPTMILGAGAVVGWYLSSGLGIEFDDADLPNIAPGTAFSEFARSPLSVACAFVDCNAAGNIVAASVPSFTYRVFTAPGIYDYRCTPCGTVGRIVVVDERLQ